MHLEVPGQWDVFPNLLLLFIQLQHLNELTCEELKAIWYFFLILEVSDL